VYDSSSDKEQENRVSPSYHDLNLLTEERASNLDNDEDHKEEWDDDDIDDNTQHDDESYIYIHTPKNNVCPADVFLGSVVPYHHLQDLHVRVVLCSCLVLSFSRNKSYLDGKLILEKECLWDSDLEFE